MKEKLMGSYVSCMAPKRIICIVRVNSLKGRRSPSKPTTSHIKDGDTCILERTGC